jgi:hypothetical protein
MPAVTRYGALFLFLRDHDRAGAQQIVGLEKCQFNSHGLGHLRNDLSRRKIHGGTEAKR